MTNKIDLNKFENIEENLKIKKLVIESKKNKIKEQIKKIINKKLKGVIQAKKDIFESIISNLDINREEHINSLIEIFCKKQKDLDYVKAGNIIKKFEGIKKKIARYNDEEIQKLGNENINVKFSNLKKTIANSTIALFEKEINEATKDFESEEMKSEDFKDDSSADEVSDVKELKELLFDFSVLNEKLNTVNEILERSYIEQEKDLKYSKKYVKKNYYYLYRKYKYKYLNLKNNLK